MKIRSFVTAIIVLGSLFVALPLSSRAMAAAATPRVGASAGGFAVDPGGASSYVVPISIPPGTAGKAPSISLTYHKLTGFSVTGLSVIHRCGSTIALDGLKGGVNYDSGDRFCLDGQRLLAVSGGNGGDGTEYRTERETFNRIFSYGTQSGGPQTFKVIGRDGNVADYGTTDDSRIEAAGKSVVRLWALAKTQDTTGSYYTVTYGEDNADGDYRPIRIDYTGNSGLAPYNSVRFTYGPRPDIAALYEGGSVQRITQRLTKLEIFADETVVRTYDLSYDNNGGASASRLTGFQECGSDGVCLLPTLFGYQAGTAGFPSDGELGSYASGMSWPAGGNLWGDVNGDGRADFVYLQSGTSTWRVMLSTGTSLAPDTAWGSSTQPIKWDTGDYPRLTDVNGDGKSDLVYYQAGTGATWRVLLSTGTSFAVDALWGTTTEGISSYGGSHQFFLVDVNGDAKTDIVYLQDGTATWRAALSATGTNTLGPDTAIGQQSSGTVSAGGYHAHYWADLNGDAKADLMYQKDGSSKWRVMLSTGTSLGQDNEWGSNTAGIKWDTGDGPRVQDVNGDGKADLVYYQAGTGGTWRVLLSTGASFAGDAVWGTTTDGISSYGGSHQVFLVDADGDGRVDLVYLKDGTATWRAALSTHGTNNVLGADGTLGTQSSGTVSTGGYHAHYLPDVNGDGKADVVYLKDGTTTLRAGLSAVGAGDLLTSITNGLGATAYVTYKPLTDPTVHTRANDAIYPYVDVQNAAYVVSRVTQSDGLGGQYATNYRYSGARSHVTGPGWLGFRTTERTDERSGHTTTTEYSQIYESGLAGNPLVTEHRFGNLLVARASNTWAGIDLGGGRRFARPDVTQEETFDLGAAPTGCARTENTYSSFDAAGSYGNWGLPSTVIVRTGTDCALANAFVTTTTNTYAHDLPANILGKLTRAQVAYLAPGTPAITRTAGFAYTPQGLVAEETIEPDSATQWQKTSYTYNGFGNRTSVTVSGPDVTPRTTSAVFDTRGRFPIGSTNALGHTSAATYEAKWGTPRTQTDANGLVASFEYDGFGRKIAETRPGGSSTTFAYTVCDAGNPCPSLGNGVSPAYVITTQTAGSSPVRQYFDMLDRVIRREGTGLSSATIYQDVWYDTMGRTVKKSQPYFTNETPTWNTLGYDQLNRPASTTDAAGVTTTRTYTGLTTTDTIVGAGIATRSRTTVKSPLGQDVSITDSLYPTKPTTYAYTAMGNLSRITDPLGNQTTITYDSRGRKAQMADPDMGTWSYTYNSLGELLSQADAKGQLQTMTYDALGRIQTRTTVEGANTWTYDTATKGVGQLASISAPGGLAETYSYDMAGRPSSTTTTIDGQNYTFATTYDQNGRLATTTYPTGFAIKNVYGTSGQLVETRNNQTNALYWQANDADARGNFTRETLGNGISVVKTYDPAKGTLNSIRSTGPGGTAVQDLAYTFDVLGNLLSRTDQIQNVSETYQYDTLNRLTAVAGPSAKTLQYNEIGNLVAKSDVGSYNYPGNGPNAVRPHAVAQVSGALNFAYSYDANGNMISGAGRAISYTSFNKPSHITADGVTVSAAYDANNNRVKKSTPTAATIYVGKLYEQVTTGSLIERKHYINGVAIYTSRSDGTNDIQYLLKDHLGSTDTITDQNGAVVQKLSYDAHGKPRNTNWTDATGPVSTLATRGFTGHETDGEAGLINMNAREYDPVLGRFLQPDTMVEATHGQGLNRYSYASNNPLSFIDPTGNSSFKKIVRTVVVAVVTFYCPACGAALQAALVKHDGGTWNQALKAGAISFASSTAMQAAGTTYSGFTNVAANGVIGGTTSKLSGGDFKSGFLGAAAGAAAAPFIRGLDIDPYGRGLVGGLAGGVAAKLGGGDFSTGAASGAVSYYLGSGMDSDRARATNTPTGSTGIWVEGNTPGLEVDYHISVGAGDLHGLNQTYSFGLPGDYRFSDLIAGPGEVYTDKVRGGQIREFYPTTASQAEAIRAQLSALDKTSGTYNLLVNQCRSFTYRELNAIIQQYDLRRAQ